MSWHTLAGLMLGARGLLILFGAISLTAVAVHWTTRRAADEYLVLRLPEIARREILEARDETRRQRRRAEVAEAEAAALRGRLAAVRIAAGDDARKHLRAVGV